jgi:hypothetical protein
MAEFFAYMYLSLELAIKLLSFIALILWIVVGVYAIKIDKSKKKEVKRLKELNDGLCKIYEVPIVKAREFFKEIHGEKLT